MSKILFLDLGNGVSGDMFAGALYSLLDSEGQKEFQRLADGAGLPGVRIVPEAVTKSGIAATKMCVLIDGEEEQAADTEGVSGEAVSAGDRAGEGRAAAPHRETEAAYTSPTSSDDGHPHHHGHSLADIESTIDGLSLDEDVRRTMKAIYASIAAAECKVHGKPVTDIHFHEVGTWDAIADIMNAAVLMKLLSPDEVWATSINVGNGSVHCAHGVLPVPAPATAELLRGLPVRRTEEENPVGELTTPTGAALVKYFVTAFGPGPEMTMLASGYGAGTKELPGQANALHAMLGETSGRMDGPAGTGSGAGNIDAANDSKTGTAAGDADNTSSTICELVFNVDDMTGEDLSFAMDCLRDGGATEAYFTPIFMKKGRPGYQVTVLSPVDAREDIIYLIFLHTTTVGLREYETRRAVLTRHYEKRHTSYGDVTVKVSEGYGVRKEKPEYEDLATLAAEHDMGIRELREALKKEL